MPRSLFRRYARWLHLDVPAGGIERGPAVARDGSTNLPGVFVVGDLTGVPLLKFACDSGAAAVQRITERATDGSLDLAILGGGVAGMAAALEAKRRGLSFVVLEAARPFSTIVNFPKGKPIFAYPARMEPRGPLQVSATVKEALVEELTAQIRGADLPVRIGAAADRIERDGDGYRVLLAEGEPVRARHVIVALGRSGSFRKLGVPGEELPKVYNRLHDPVPFRGQEVLVVGGGDSAIEAAVALAAAGARVSLSYRGAELTRPKPGNLGALRGAKVRLLLPSRVAAIRPAEVELESGGKPLLLPNDAVFALLGREPPLDFFRKSGIPILGEMTARKWTALSLFVAFCALLYGWKGGLFRIPRSPNPGTLYGFLYSAAVLFFGVRRIRRRKTPYVTRQTLTLMAIQLVPLFLLPEFLLPWLDGHGLLPEPVKRLFFPGGSYWRAYGLILAWPLFFWNLATEQPLWGWLVLSLLQTFVAIPLLVRRFGKGAYCGWICSCGALAETMGDAHRAKALHGPVPNRWNLAGQILLAFAFLAFAWRVAGWILPGPDLFARSFDAFFLPAWHLGVDLFLAGVVGVGLYFWFSGRVWCRHFCPLAALMHVYAKFSRFRIFAEKDRCISCNVCTTVCHQGIDVMSFANRGRAVSDVECVRCSACVQECPTGTLSFGAADASGRPERLDRLPASTANLREGRTPDMILPRLQVRFDP